MRTKTRIIKVHGDFDALVRQMQTELEPKWQRNATMINVTKYIADEWKKKRRRGDMW